MILGGALLKSTPILANVLNKSLTLPDKLVTRYSVARL